MSDPHVQTDNPRSDVLLALALAFVFRLWFLLVMDRAIDMADAIHYINMAKGFSGGNFLTFDENLPVLYSILGMLVHLVIDDWEHAFWAVSLVASSLLVIPVYYLARELHGSTAAKISALLVALWPWLIDYGSRVSTETLAVTLWFGSVWLLYLAMEKGGKFLALSLVSFFALHLTRPEGTFLLLASPIAASILCYKRGPEFYKRLRLYAVGCVGLISAYAVVMKLLIGTATVSYRAPMPGDLGDYFERGAEEFARTFLHLNFNVLPVMMGPLLLVFWGVGFFRKSDGTRKYRLEACILFFCFVQWALTLANFSPAPRYIMAVVVALSLWSAQGILMVSQRGAGMRHGRLLKMLPLLLVVGTFLLGTFAEVAAEKWGNRPRTPVEYRLAGEWMQTNLERGLIVSRKPQVGFYADMPTVGPPMDATPESVIEFARETGARYIVMDERHSASMIPRLASLLDTTTGVDGLTLLNGELSPYTGVDIVVYEITAPGIDYLSEDSFPDSSSHMGPDEQRRKK